MTGSIEHGSLSVDTPDGVFSAYVSRPATISAPCPAVIVFQEIFGVNDFVRGVCDRLAAHGMIATAPDIFWRQEPGVELAEDERERAMALMQGLDQARAVDDAQALLDELRSRPDCNGKVGAVGYCLGGKLAYLAAIHTAIDAAVSYYGVGIHGALDEAWGIGVPLLLHQAREDVLCPPAAQAEIAAAMDGNALVTIATHDAGHAFARTGSPVFVERCARIADARTLKFLAEHL